MLIEVGRILGIGILDELVKSRKSPFFVIPANTLKGTRAGIQLFQHVLDTGVRRCDVFLTFYEIIILQLEYVNSYKQKLFYD